MTKFDIHGAVSVAQCAKDYGSFRTLEWVVTDESGETHEITLFSALPLAITPTPEIVSSVPEELASSTETA